MCAFLWTIRCVPCKLMSFQVAFALTQRVQDATNEPSLLYQWSITDITACRKLGARENLLPSIKFLVGMLLVCRGYVPLLHTSATTATTCCTGRAHRHSNLRASQSWHCTVALAVCAVISGIVTASTCEFPFLTLCAVGNMRTVEHQIIRFSPQLKRQ